MPWEGMLLLGTTDTVHDGEPDEVEVTEADIEQVLEFWFGACGPDGALDRTRQKMWFGTGHQHDATIRKRFGKLHRRAAHGELDAVLPVALASAGSPVRLEGVARRLKVESKACRVRSEALPGHWTLTTTAGCSR